MKKIKINEINPKRFSDNIISSLNKISGGDNAYPSGGGCNINCCCGCQYAGQGGSSQNDNCHANEAKGLHSPSC